MELIIASGNQKKLKELDAILKGTNLSVRSILKEEEIEVMETEKTFEGNAKLKALAYAKHLNGVVIADDSGLCVESLDGMPGIFSKRYSGLGDYENNIKLLDVLKNEKRRNAYFICVIVVAFPDGKTFTYEGKWNGVIAYEMKGVNGFGYDPIFIPNGCNDVVANLTNEFKMKNSHRYKALHKMVEDKDEITNYWRYSWQK